MSHVLAWALRHARQQTLSLVVDVADDQMWAQSTPGERHPSWVLGHLLLADTYLLSLLGVQPLTDSFSQLLSKYGPAAPPVARAGLYDSKAILVRRLTETDGRRVAWIQSMQPKDLDRPTPDPALATSQPTLGHHLQSLVFHEGYHSGQLSAWRKARDFTPSRWTFAPRGT